MHVSLKLHRSATKVQCIYFRPKTRPNLNNCWICCHRQYSSGALQRQTQRQPSGQTVGPVPEFSQPSGEWTEWSDPLPDTGERWCYLIAVCALLLQCAGLQWDNIGELIWIRVSSPVEIMLQIISAVWNKVIFLLYIQQVQFKLTRSSVYVFPL